MILLRSRKYSIRLSGLPSTITRSACRPRIRVPTVSWMPIKRAAAEVNYSLGLFADREVDGKRYTAQQLAATEHVSGRFVAKPVIVFADDKLAMLVMPANRRVDKAQSRQEHHGAMDFGPAALPEAGAL